MLSLIDVPPCRVRLISIETLVVRVVTTDDEIFEFRYRSEQEITAALAAWAKMTHALN